GTGKTLALLCSALAWQKKCIEKKEIYLTLAPKEQVDVPKQGCTCSAIRQTTKQSEESKMAMIGAPGIDVPKDNFDFFVPETSPAKKIRTDEALTVPNNGYESLASTLQTNPPIKKESCVSVQEQLGNFIR